MGKDKDQEQRLVEVEDVDDVLDCQNKNELSTSSLNKQSKVQIDQFMSAVTSDSKIDRDMMRKSTRYSMMAGDHGLTIVQGCLAILSTCVGGGIVSIPLATYNLGVPLALFLQILVIIVTHLTSHMYLSIKDLVPDKPESLYEIGYMIYGRGSIFWLCSIFLFNSFGLCLLYFIVFGDTAATMVANIVYPDQTYDSIWWTSRKCYSVPLALLLLPLVLKKELAEFAWISYVLFSSLALFVLVNFIQLTFDSNFEATGLEVDVLYPKAKWSTVSALSATMIAYSYQQNIFPIFSELRNKTNQEYQTVSSRGLPLTFSIYAMVGIICALMFGDQLQSSVLLSLSDAKHSDDPDKSFWEAYLCQASFCIVLMCHVPFIFFSGKEALLILVDEIMRKSISNALWHKLQSNEQFASDPRHSEAPNPDLPCPGDDTKMTYQSLVSRASENSNMGDALKQSKMRSQALLTRVSAVVAQRMAYKEMNSILYVSLTVGLYALIVFVAMLAPQDISSILDLVSAYAVSCAAFFIPSFYYRKSLERFKLADPESPEVKRNILIAKIFMGLGVFNALASCFSVVLTLAGLTDSGH